VKGNQIKPDPLASKNSKRRDFCAKHDGYGDFCDGLHSLVTLLCWFKYTVEHETQQHDDTLASLKAAAEDD